MFRKITDAINRYNTFLITAHVRIDGDALGSELALYHMLRQMGKGAIVYNQDETPSNYRFLPGADHVVHELPSLGNVDGVFILDCSELKRVGDEAEKIATAANIINIDHHVSNGGFSQIRLIDPQASSTGELLYRLAVHMGIAISGDVANCLYAAILTDTGCFRYGSTKKDTLIAAGNLVEKGADPQWISENIYESSPLQKIMLLAKALETLSLEGGGRIGSLVVTQRSLRETGALPEHTEGFVDLPRTIRGVEIAILYNELADNQFKISLRSKGKVNVERVAKAFGGGGHVNAAACMIEGELPDIRSRILRVIEFGSERISRG
ncbi:MAG: bifunctional oligoribonuclease/PAP phosphatase NrnA [Deltaproteobacteria bacterium]|nr:bifunctional oligoribonuclease/PAP phosphatase NrnA [Deltaproteobacteria bacterium]